MGEDRQFYEFWWEYLRRSTEYRSFCKRTDKETPTSLADFALRENWQRFGDIFNRSFDEWWSEEQKKRKRKVVNLCEDQEEQYSIYAYYAVLGQEMIRGNVESIGKSLKAFFQRREKDGYLYLMVNLNNKPTSRAIHDVIEERCHIRKQSKKKAKRFGNIREEYQTYLDVYDRRNENMKWKDVIEEIGTQADKDAEFEVTKRKYQRYRKNAEELIKSAEYGIFPKRVSDLIA